MERLNIPVVEMEVAGITLSRCHSRPVPGIGGGCGEKIKPNNG